MSISIRDFSGGLNTKLPPSKIAANQLTVAENVIVRNGQAEPLKGLGSAQSTGLPSGSTWQWLYKLDNVWLGDTSRVYAVNWQDDYLAYLTVGTTQAYWRSAIGAPVTLGLARPATAMTCNPNGSGPITGTISYVCTFYDSYGQESGSSPESVVTATSKHVDITNIPIGPSGTVGRRIYRTLGGTYLLVTTITNNTTTTYTDNTADHDLGDPIPTVDAGPCPPIEGMAISAYLARIWAWVNNEVYWSVAGAPWLWTGQSIIIDEDVAAMAPTATSLLVLTAARPYLILGSNEASFTLRNVNNTFGTTAPFSLVQTDRGLVWWCSQGLAMFNGDQFRLLTDDYLTVDQIEAYDTTNMLGVFSNGYYYLFHSGGALIADMRQKEPTITTSTQTIDAAFVDKDGTFYAGSGNSVRKWDDGSNLTMRIKTRAFVYENRFKPYHVKRAAVWCSAAVTPQWYQLGNAHGSYSPVSPAAGVAEVFAAPGLWTDGQLQLTTTGSIQQIEINQE